MRKVEKTDISECVELIRKSFITVAEEFSITIENAPRFTAFATTEERLLWHLEKECRPMYVYCENGHPVGYYSLQIQENGVCELNNLCVLPAYRHKGIGRKLLEHAFAIAAEENCVRMKLGIVEENMVLKTWYESFGFVHTGTKKFDFFPFTCGYMEKEL